jgi:hypothetical protein
MSPGCGAEDRDDISKYFGRGTAAHWHWIASEVHFGIKEDHCLCIWSITESFCLAVFSWLLRVSHPLIHSDFLTGGGFYFFPSVGFHTI